MESVQMKSIDNNVYLVTTPEGITLAHLGDQINEGDFMIDYDWIDQVAKHHQVDRLPYWGDDAYLELNYAELKKSKYPVIVTVWGESYQYIPKK